MPVRTAATIPAAAPIVSRRMALPPGIGGAVSDGSPWLEVSDNLTCPADGCACGPRVTEGGNRVGCEGRLGMTASVVSEVADAYFEAWRAGDFVRLRSILAD